MKKTVLALSLLLGTTVAPANAAYEHYQTMLDEEAELEIYLANYSYADSDPLEPINRAFFYVNYDVLDPYIYKPASEMYATYVPRVMREAINNAMKNLDEPSSAVNQILQGKFSDSANSAGRFVINSTVGIFGLIEVADHLGMKRKQDEFGEAMGYWGVPQGPYLMLPVLGPNTVREETGDFVDGLYFPLALLNFWASLGKWALEGLYDRGQLAEQERMLEQSLDPYIFVREAYLQYQDFRLYDGDLPEPEPLDDSYLEEFFDGTGE